MTDFKLNFSTFGWANGESEIEARDPSHLGHPVGVFARIGTGDLGATLDQVRTAQPEWVADRFECRQTVLTNMDKGLMARAESPEALLSRKEGEISVEDEVFRASQIFTHCATECPRQFGEDADSVRDRSRINVRCELEGVVAAVSPLNFPTAIASGTTRPALHDGSVVVWKPANVTSASVMGTHRNYRAAGYSQRTVQPRRGIGPFDWSTDYGELQDEREPLCRFGTGGAWNHRSSGAELRQDPDGYEIQERPRDHG